MSPKRQIKGKEFIEDIRAGMTTADILEKYGLTADGLRKIFRILLHSSAMEKVELEGSDGLYAHDEDITLRRHRRTSPNTPIWVYDGVDQLKGFPVTDVSQRGIGVKGIKTFVGDARTFIVRFKSGSSAKPFVFDARCRWVRENAANPGEALAGFEITGISKFDEQALRKLILV